MNSTTPDYSSLFGKLKDTIETEYICVSRKKNPVSINLCNSNPAQLTYQLGQYAYFPRNIVLFLTAAQERARASGWSRVEAELSRNIGQELGSDTDGRTHYDMLVQGVHERIGIDARQVAPSPSTVTFIHHMLTMARNDNPVYSLAGTLATETSAVPELHIVRSLAKTLFQCVDGSRTMGNTLDSFFAGHIGIWEPTHAAYLSTALCHDLHGRPKWEDDLETGFRSVLTAMDTWWMSIYQESMKI